MVVELLGEHVGEARFGPVADGDLGVSQQAGRVVLGAHREFQHIEGVGEVELASFPIPELEGAAARIASATVPLDPDGAVRRAFDSLELQGSSMPSMVMVSPIRAASPNSAAIRRTVVAGMVVISWTFSGGYLATCSRRSSNDGRPGMPAAS